MSSLRALVVGVGGGGAGAGAGSVDGDSVHDVVFGVHGPDGSVAQEGDGEQATHPIPVQGKKGHGPIETCGQGIAGDRKQQCHWVTKAGSMS